jgi:hypothetical protein
MINPDRWRSMSKIIAPIVRHPVPPERSTLEELQDQTRTLYESITAEATRLRLVARRAKYQKRPVSRRA